MRRICMNSCDHIASKATSGRGRLLVWTRWPSTALSSVREADTSAKVMVRHRPIHLRPPPGRESPAEGKLLWHPSANAVNMTIACCENACCDRYIVFNCVSMITYHA